MARTVNKRREFWRSNLGSAVSKAMTKANEDVSRLLRESGQTTRWQKIAIRRNSESATA